MGPIFRLRYPHKIISTGNYELILNSHYSKKHWTFTTKGWAHCDASARGKKTAPMTTFLLWCYVFCGSHVCTRIYFPNAIEFALENLCAIPNKIFTFGGLPVLYCSMCPTWVSLGALLLMPLMATTAEQSRPTWHWGCLLDADLYPLV